jgi:hypothetical protein
MARFSSAPPLVFKLRTAQDMQPLIGLERAATNRSLSVRFNGTGSATFTTSLHSPAARYLKPWNTALLVEFGTGVDRVPIWSGPLKPRERQRPQDTVTVSATGWKEKLDRRVTRSRLTYTNVLDGQIAANLIDHVNGFYPTRVTPGTIGGSAARTRTIERDASIGQEIDRLVNLEHGFDWQIDPITRQFNTFARRGTDRSDNVRLAYDLPPYNLESFQEALDSENLVNRHISVGRFARALSEDFASMSDMDLLSEQVERLSDVTDATILAAYSAVEVAFRAYPRPVYTVTPKALDDPNVPVPFIDFDLGDTIHLLAHMPDDDNIDALVRFFGCDMQIDDNGSVKITSMQFTAS